MRPSSFVRGRTAGGCRGGHAPEAGGCGPGDATDSLRPVPTLLDDTTVRRNHRDAHRAAWTDALRTADRAARAAASHLSTSRSRLDLAFLARRTPAQQAALLLEEAHDLVRAAIARAFPGHLVIGRQETGFRPGVDTGPVWLVDALDGEAAYVGDRPGWAVSVALAIDGRLRLGVVHDPSDGATYRTVAGLGAQVDLPAGDGQPARRVTMRPSACERLGAAQAAARFPKPGSPTMVTFSHEFGRASQACAGAQRCTSTALAMAQVAAGRLDAFWTHGHDVCSSAAGLLLLAESGASVRARDGLALLDTRSVAACAPSIAYDFHALLAGL